ncbi:hypothetical protein RCH20_002512 [Psychrobacter sp. PL15]|nr:hypothetical protein [Psychrobacter sp. PL15]
MGAAVSYATGNDALTGGISAGAGEASAPLISKFLYGTSDFSDLTADQKDTVSAITSALGVGIGATTGSANDAANAAETNKVAVEDNWAAEGHFSTTAAVMYLGGFPPKVAEAIGYAAWGPDTDTRNAITFYNVAGDRNVTAQREIHLLDSMTNLNDIAQQRTDIETFLVPILREIYLNPARASEILKNPNVQNALHSYGDSFAHVRADGTHYAPWQGHLEDMENPDQPNSNPQAYKNYVEGLQKLVNRATRQNINGSAINRIANEVVRVNGENDQISTIQNIVNDNSSGRNNIKAESAIPGCRLNQKCAISGSLVDPQLNLILNGIPKPKPKPIPKGYIPMRDR